MNRNTIPLGRIIGIPIRLDYSWFLIFALFTWSLAGSYYPGEFKNWPLAQYWILGATTAILLFVSVVIHELGHSVIALRYKIPVRSITLFFFGGVAQIESEPPSAIAEFWIAIAGPITSFLLAILFYLLQPLAGAFESTLALAKYLAYINGSLALFNLIPGFPLDGGRIFRAIIWGATRNMHRATIIAANLGRIIAYLLIVVGVWQMLSGNIGNGLWIAFIGWFLDSAAASQIQQQTIHNILAGRRVSDTMRHEYVSVNPGSTIDELVDEHILGSGQRRLVVEEAGRVTGLLTLEQIKAIPRTDWQSTTAAQAMLPIDQIKRIRPDAKLEDALREMDRDGVGQLPVMLGDQIQGMLGRDDVISLLRTVNEIESK